MSRIRDLVMITDYNNLEESSLVIGGLFLNNKKSLTIDLQEHLLSESLLYGNYFVYDLIDEELKDKETLKQLKDSILIRIDSILSYDELKPYDKEFIKPLNKLKVLFQNNYTKKEKMDVLFKEYAILEFAAINLLNIDVLVN